VSVGFFVAANFQRGWFWRLLRVSGCAIESFPLRIWSAGFEGCVSLIVALRIVWQQKL
jgi:hypothetical protein